MQQRGCSALIATLGQQRFAQGIYFTHHLSERINRVALSTLGRYPTAFG
jgi:hypothetical protein